MLIPVTSHPFLAKKMDGTRRRIAAEGCLWFEGFLAQKHPHLLAVSNTGPGKNGRFPESTLGLLWLGFALFFQFLSKSSVMDDLIT